MNIWWFIIAPMSLLWLIPMTIMHRAHAPIWVFLIQTAFLCLVAVFAEPMYEWGTSVGKRLGHTRIVALRERLQSKVLPPAKAALFIMAAMSLAFGIAGRLG